jgi:hypothetical protein
MEVSGQLHTPPPPDALHPRKDSPTSIKKEAGRSPEPVWTRWRREKSLLCPFREWNPGHSVRNLAIILTELPWLLNMKECIWKIRAVIAQSLQRWATGWRRGVLVFDSRRGLGIFLFSTSRATQEPSPPSFLSNGYQGLFPWG